MFRSISLLRRRISQIKRCRIQETCIPYTTTNEMIVPEADEAATYMQSAFSNPWFFLLSTCKNAVSLRSVHGLLTVHGFMGDLSCVTKLVSKYGGFGYTRVARLAFDQIPQPDLYSMKVMLRCHFLNEESLEVVKFYDWMRMKGFVSDNVVFSMALNACSDLRDLDEGRKIHCQIVKVADPDSFVLTGLLCMYAKCGEIKNSREMFDDISSRNVVCWTSMIAGYVQNDCPKEGLILFNRMRNNMVLGNEITFGNLVAACTRLGAVHQGKWLHGYLIKSGMDLKSYMATCLLDMYVKCGDIRDARLVFDEHSSADFVLWTAMIVGYTHHGCANEALSLFKEMQSAGIMPSCVTVAGVLSGCGQLDNLEMGRSVHSLSLKLGLWDHTVANTLVNMYGKCHQNRDSFYAFEMETDKDVVAWNSIISGFSQNGSAQEALLLFHCMLSESVAPDAVTVVSILSACASLGALSVGSSLHAYSVKSGFLSPSNVYVGTALLDFYAKCGDVEYARTVFDAMEEKNTITWSAMIGGYGKQGDTKGSLEIFDEMLKRQKKPNEATFTSILSVCSHTGMIEEGKKYFSSMYKDYKYTPSTKHYACMVDMLARAGKLEEALDVIEKMPVQPDERCFGAFLHGCGLHARWDQVNQVRELMKQRGMNKIRGHSKHLNPGIVSLGQ
ncbi:PREDICTED: pentatricopeptide repeat-containing protein At2g03380, mitochondrial isoform X2 [Tarenaya hassleriana]|uniref:pentatricopeptide repeat-containing protein At2g03380, mitochondrial isoform X2 n=1 Tax=Tarenaya hassleriana TaxID=28532 RepID=UPI00053C3251|nr:PREDICTED: pentatricopeptide repeat-containing protein At2g03380, mitochondrial isoform X2 [Tarenaya hassleriana]